MNDQNFNVESIGHDIRSTQFSKNGCCDTLTANDFKDPTIVAYAIENHPNDSRVTIDPNGIVQTLSSRMGTGGNNTPFALIECGSSDVSCFGVYSHPMAGMIRIENDVCPTMTVKMAKGASDGPLLLVEVDDEYKEQLPDALGCTEQTDLQ